MKVMNNISQGKKQYVVFELSGQEYGLDIYKVTTIQKLSSITRVPKTPAYVKGVVNLRGDIIPIIDLRIRFNMKIEEKTENTRLIVLKMEDNSLGIIVDKVDEVLQLDEDEIEAISNFSSDLTMDYILGVGKAGLRIVTLLNIEKLMEIN